MTEHLITLPVWEVREWKAGHALLFGLITDPSTAVAVTAALAEYTAARWARRTAAEPKDKTPTSPLDDTESKKAPTNPPVIKKLSGIALCKARNRTGYERRTEQRRLREEETKLKLKPSPRKSPQPLSRENTPGPVGPVVLHHDDMAAIADLLGESQGHYSRGSPQRPDEPKAIPLSNPLEEKTTPPSSSLKEAAESQTNTAHTTQNADKHTAGEEKGKTPLAPRALHAQAAGRPAAQVADQETTEAKASAAGVEPPAQLGLNIIQPATTLGPTYLATNAQSVMPVLGVPGSPPVNEAAASKTAGPGPSRTPPPEEEKQVTKTKGAEWRREPHGRLAREEAENVPTSRFADEATRLGLSKNLESTELTATELKYFERNTYGVQAWAKDQQRGGRFSLEAAFRVYRQVEYFLSAEHLEDDKHARNLFESNGMGFYIKDLMSWSRLAGVTEMELMGVCESFRHDKSYEWDDVYIHGSDDEYWDNFTDEEKASADLKELFVASADCERYFQKRNQSSD